jgi:hypothetical protein
MLHFENDGLASIDPSLLRRCCQRYHFILFDRVPDHALSFCAAHQLPLDESSATSNQVKASVLDACDDVSTDVRLDHLAVRAAESEQHHRA